MPTIRLPALTASPRDKLNRGSSKAGSADLFPDFQKDDSGVWRGKAMKDGKSVDVSLDFQGNVIAR